MDGEHPEKPELRASEYLESGLQARQEGFFVEQHSQGNPVIPIGDGASGGIQGMINHEETKGDSQLDVMTTSNELHAQHTGAMPVSDDEAISRTTTEEHSQLSDHSETRSSKRTKRISFTIKDGNKEWDSVIAVFDSGSKYNLIAPEIVKLHGLRPLPLLPHHRWICSPIDHTTKIELTHFVEMCVKCKKLGLGEQVMKLGILKIKDEWDILVGRKFMLDQRLFRKLQDWIDINEDDEDDESLPPFSPLRESRSKGT